MRSLLRLATAAVLCAVVSPAWANGRFPESLRLLEDPRDPTHLALSGTFGLLLTEDRGQNWYYLCEKLFAFDFAEGDPLLEVMSDGALLSGINGSANLSQDCGCTWKATLDAAPLQMVRDLSVDTSAPDSVVALRQDGNTTPAIHQVHESTDRGRTWRKISELPRNTLFSYTLDLAPSDPTRLYVSAVAPPPGGRDAGLDRGVLYVSRNRGTTWEELLIPGTDANVEPYIAAVHPQNPDTVFVRTSEWRDVDPAANDALLVTTDAGKTWREVLRKGAKMFGFAISPDASTVVVGLGDPRQATRTTEPADFGIYKASTKDLVFEKIFGGMVSCLRWTARGLYVCNTQFNPEVKPDHFELGLALSADFTASTQNPFEVLLDLKKVLGPPRCAAATCNDVWSKMVNGNPAVCDQLQASCTPAGGAISCGTDAGAPPEPPAADGGRTDAPGGTGGIGGAGTGGAGTGGAPGDDGCGCRLTPRNTRSWAPFAAVALFALTRLRRKVDRGRTS